MKRVMTLCVLVLTLTMALCSAALAADLGSAATAAQVCYPTSISRSEDGTELKKIYDLGPEDDPAGIPRSDFEQDGFHYTLTDLLKQELPENESRQHTETVSLPSKNKDMESVLALLPAEKEFVTDDGLTGILSLDLSTVRVEVAGYGSSTKEVSATRSYPNLAGQDTQYIPKTIEEDGRTLTLQTVNWQTDNTANMDGYAVGDRFTAVATYTGTATSSYVKGYTVTADYTGTVSRIALNKVRYHAFRKQNISTDQRWERLLDKLDGKELTPSSEAMVLTGSRRLSMNEISFQDDMSECGSLLNFYVPVTFDPDAVFGTNVATDANDDYLNVYADFDLDVGEVCDALTVIQVCGDGSEETYRYPLTEEDRSILRAKMNDYCMEQTGLSLDDYRAQYLDEEMCSSSFPDGQTM